MAFAYWISVVFCHFIAWLVAGTAAIVGVVCGAVGWGVDRRREARVPPFAGYDVDENGGWVPRHGPQGDCWVCHHGGFDPEAHRDEEQAPVTGPET